MSSSTPSDHEFADEHLFFRFVPENERGGLTKNSDNVGKFVQWSDFLGPASGSFDRKDKDASSLLPLLHISDNLNSIDKKDQHVVSQVWPLDEYNTNLLNNVHPPSWKDPNAHNKDGSYTYDMVVIGGGTGGLITAAGSAGVGARVAMIEAHMLGGDCLNVGCVPSKAIIHSAKLVHTLRGDMDHLEEAGISVDPGAVKVDFEKVMERIRKLRSGISNHDSAERYSQDLGVQIFLGRAKFSSPTTVEVNGKTLTFKRAVVATGGYPALLPIAGLKELHDKATAWEPTSAPRPLVMTNETVFNMTKQPKNMLVIGAGVIGLELAQAMQRLGTTVTVLGRSGRVLPKEDEDLAQVVKDQMIKDGVNFRLDVSEYKKVELTGTVRDNGYPEMILIVQEKGNNELTEFIFDALLVAAGRRPNVAGIDLEAAKIDYDVKKGLLVNDNLQTTNPRVFGVGDCCSEFKFTHAADFMARAVIRNALFLGKEKTSELLIPYATFTSPEIASVGLYESDLKAKGIEFRIYEKHFKDNDRAKLDSKTAGMVRFRVDAKSDKILGASIVGEGAGNMISEVTLAMQSGTGLGALAAVIHPYPTTAESIRQAGDLYNKARLTTTVKKLLRGIIQIQH